VGKVSQQIMRQVGEQDVALLTGKAALAPCFQAQTGFVIAKLLDFGSTPLIVEAQVTAFGGQDQGRDIVAVLKLPVLPSALHKNTYRVPIIERGSHLAEPGIFRIGVPALHLPGQRFGSPVGQALGQDVVTPCQQPDEVFVRASPTIQAPDGTLALLGR